MSDTCITKVLKGTDMETSTFKFYDDEGTPIPIGTIDDYNIYVYGLKGDKKVLYFTYMKTPTGDAKPIEVVDTYTISFVVDRQQTLAVPTGILYIEIVAKFPSTTEYILSQKKSGKDGYILCEIVDSANPHKML